MAPCSLASSYSNCLFRVAKCEQWRPDVLWFSSPLQTIQIYYHTHMAAVRLCRLLSVFASIISVLSRYKFRFSSHRICFIRSDSLVFSLYSFPQLLLHRWIYESCRNINQNVISSDYILHLLLWLNYFLSRFAC